jgi:curved DNA-binding protein CbpA
VSGLAGGADPFAALGLPPRADLTDDDVRAAWRRIATATHPDRADGGDPGRFAVAAAAYTVLRTRSGRGEALADLASPSPALGRSRPPTLRSRPPIPWPRRPEAPPRPDASARPDAAAGTDAPPATWPGHPGAARLLSRIRRGRPARLALRVLIAAALSAVAVAVAGSQPATPALITGALTWLLLTARHDLAPTPDHHPPSVRRPPESRPPPGSNTSPSNPSPSP